MSKEDLKKQKKKQEGLTTFSTEPEITKQDSNKDSTEDSPPEDRSLFRRFRDLISKLLSYKNAVLILATVLLWFGKLPPWSWIVTMIVALFGRYGLKFIKHFSR